MVDIKLLEEKISQYDADIDQIKRENKVKNDSHFNHLTNNTRHSFYSVFRMVKLKKIDFEDYKDNYNLHSKLLETYLTVIKQNTDFLHLEIATKEGYPLGIIFENNTKNYTDALFNLTQ